MKAADATKYKKQIDLDELVKINPKVDREQVAKALAVIKKLLEDGIAPLDERECNPFGRDGVISPDPTYDPRTVRLRSQL